MREGARRTQVRSSWLKSASKDDEDDGNEKGVYVAGQDRNWDDVADKSTNVVKKAKRPISPLLHQGEDGDDVSEDSDDDLDAVAWRNMKLGDLEDEYQGSEVRDIDESTSPIKLSPKASISDGEELSSSIEPLTDPAPATQTKANGSRAVSFAPSPRNPNEFMINMVDSQKSLPQLLQTISLLREKLSQVQIDLSAEKVLRKKKEKNVIKLAKQLNLRSEEMREKDAQIAQISLETKHTLLKDLLDTLTTKNDDANRAHHDEITSYQSQLRKVRSTADERINELSNENTSCQAQLRKVRCTTDELIAALNTAHSKTCEDLRRQLLMANLDSDRFRVRLAKGSPKNGNGNARGNEGTHHRTINNSLKLKKRRSKVTILVAASVAALMVGSVAVLRDTVNGCAPLKPSLRFDQKVTDTAHDSPWWAPAITKGVLHSIVCPHLHRSRLNWSLKQGVGEISVSIMSKNGQWSDVRRIKKVLNYEITKAGVLLCRKKFGYVERVPLSSYRR